MHAVVAKIILSLIKYVYPSDLYFFLKYFNYICNQLVNIKILLNYFGILTLIYYLLFRHYHNRTHLLLPVTKHITT